MPVEDAFLEIITHGPYHLDPKEEIEELCIVIHHALAPTLREQKKVQRSRSGTGPSPACAFRGKTHCYKHTEASRQHNTTTNNQQLVCAYHVTRTVSKYAAFNPLYDQKTPLRGLVSTLRFGCITLATAVSSIKRRRPQLVLSLFRPYESNI
ncbi:hypothetical protein BDV35DRAFT_391604 [Aspergillus flavus]|uniref:Uncharacterized protein n=1 Tax=Aspergillus flavus TaxID=5059 RepID=A0A5N6H0R6_ASPFL|nr:hypothetical protein BDV35DRAFT_391604 [Aspergillus flavus]